MKSTLRRTWAEIDLDALEHNYHILRERVGEAVKFLGVVKGDAYGHGSVQISKKLEALGADYLAVSSVDEGMEIRKQGIQIPILILGHTPKEETANLLTYNLTQTVTCKVKALEYDEEAGKLGGKLKVHMKVDTGMSRLGFLCSDDLFESGVTGIVEACQLPNLEAEGIFTHFSMADEGHYFAKRYTDDQFTLFKNVVEQVEAQWGQNFSIRHCANTGAVAKYPETYMDMVRPGLLLYGYGEYAKLLNLVPVMTLKTTLSTIKVYPKDTAIGYGGIYVTNQTTRVGVLPIGYADGYFRSLSNKWHVHTQDGPAQQLGKICMDMCMINLTDCPNVDVGSEIEVFGKKNSINEMAELAGTIPYELTVAVSKRVPRKYISNGQIVNEELLLRGE